LILVYKLMVVWVLAAAAISGLSEATPDQKQRAEAEQNTNTVK
jgi:hypothetical protein